MTQKVQPHLQRHQHLPLLEMLSKAKLWSNLVVEIPHAAPMLSSVPNVTSSSPRTLFLGNDYYPLETTLLCKVILIIDLDAMPRYTIQVSNATCASTTARNKETSGATVVLSMASTLMGTVNTSAHSRTANTVSMGDKEAFKERLDNAKRHIKIHSAEQNATVLQRNHVTTTM